MLITGADEEMRIWKWSDLLKLEQDATSSVSFLHECHHQQARGNRGAMMPLSETNDIACNSEVSFLTIDNQAHSHQPMC